MRLVLPLFARPIRWGGVCAVAAVIFYGSILTVPPAVGPSEQDVFWILSDVFGFTAAKWRHFLAYGTLAFAVAYATDHWTMGRRTHLLFVIGVCSSYGLAIEIGQSFLSHRVFDWTDILANTLGSALVFPWFGFRSRIELVPPSELRSRLQRTDRDSAERD